MDDKNNYPYDIEINPAGAPNSADVNLLKIAIRQSENCSCKIKLKDGGSGTGFFSLIPFPDKTMKLRTLMTNHHVLGKSDIEIGKQIQFSINNEKKQFNIVIDEKRKVYTNKAFDITIIEIKKEDGIKDDSYLDIDDQIFEEEIQNFINKSIYLLHYPKGGDANISQGVIKTISIDGYNIHHLCSTDVGSSGTPILYLHNNKLIGIHKGGEKKQKNWNCGTLLKLPIEKFNENFINNNL